MEISMRVITGTARGRRLITRDGDDVRPTTDRVKEAMFSILQFELEGKTVLDAFAGSGQLGIEALSRGAEKATFLDAAKESVEIINKNLQTTKLGSQARVLHGDSISFLRSTREKFDIILMDPPYNSGLLQKGLPLAAEIAAPDGVIICESLMEEELPESAGAFKMVKRYRYGRVALTVYRNEEADQ